MTLEDRVSNLESSTYHILRILEQHTQELAAIRRTQNDHSVVLQTIIATQKITIAAAWRVLSDAR